MDSTLASTSIDLGEEILNKLTSNYLSSSTNPPSHINHSHPKRTKKKPKPSSSHPNKPLVDEDKRHKSQKSRPARIVSQAETEPDPLDDNDRETTTTTSQQEEPSRSSSSDHHQHRMTLVDSQDILLNEIKDLGGNEEDLDLFRSLPSWSSEEEAEELGESHQPVDPQLVHDLKDFIKGLDFSAALMQTSSVDASLDHDSDSIIKPTTTNNSSKSHKIHHLKQKKAPRKPSSSLNPSSSLTTNPIESPKAAKKKKSKKKKN